MNKLTVGDVVQINALSPNWKGCLMVVTSSSKDGVKASMQLPGKGITYADFTYNQVDFIGITKMIPKEKR